MLGDDDDGDEVLVPFVNTLVLDDEVLGGGVDVLIGLTSFDVLLGLPPLPFTALTLLIVFLQHLMEQSKIQMQYQWLL